MGIIAQRIAERFEEVRNDSGWLTRDDDTAMGPQTTSGVRVNRNAALGLTTIWRCVDLLASTISQSPKDIILKVGGRSFPEFTKPSWLVEPNPLDPTYTANDYFAQVALSLLIDGNYFVSVYPYILDPQVLTVLDPALVDVKPGPVYEIRDRTGKVVSRVGPMEMLHGTWIRPAGALRGISPLENLRRAMGNAIAAEEHAGRFFGQGASLSFGVEVPGKMDNEKLGNLRESLSSKYVGLRKSHAIGVLTDGSKFVSGLAPTPEQAQMLATRKFAVEDLCRPYGVPPNMAGSQEPGASSYASADIWRDEFRDYAALPLAVRIEAQHNRLVSVPDTITDPNASAQFKFNLDHVARTSLLTRYQAYGEGVRGGFLTPNAALAREDQPPVPGGDRLYMQQQMAPIETNEQSIQSNALGALVRAGFEPAAAAAFLGIPPIAHTGLVPITVQPDPEDTQPGGPARSVKPVNVTFAADAFRGLAPVTVQPAQVTVEGSTTNVAAPSLEPLVEWMEQRSVQPAPEIIVNVPPPAPVRKRFERDEKGQITAMIEE